MKPALVEILYAAYRSEHGIIVRSTEPDLLRRQLYRERKIDDDLKILSFYRSPVEPETEIWIVKNEKK